MQDFRRRPWLAALLGAVVVILAALGATSSLGPLIADPPRPPVSIPAPPPAEAPSQAPSELPHEDDEEPLPQPLPTWLSELVRVLLWLAGAAAVVAVIFLATRSLRHIETRQAAPGGEGVEISTVDEDELVESVEETIERLRVGVDVDDAVIECWRRLEAAAANAGVARRPTQTSEEYTVEVLSGTSADEESLRELGALYAQAWYSGQVLGGDSRAAAVACLERLRASLGVRT